MARSSSYPRSTTACRRALVTESLVANKVTSQPRETSPSAILPATVSQAPYCRGGVRQATGARIATLLAGIIDLQAQCRLHLRSGSARIPPGYRRGEIVIEASGYGHVSVGHRDAAGRIVAPPS